MICLIVIGLFFLMSCDRHKLSKNQYDDDNAGHLHNTLYLLKFFPVIYLI